MFEKKNYRGIGVVVCRVRWSHDPGYVQLLLAVLRIRFRHVPSGFCCAVVTRAGAVINAGTGIAPDFCVCRTRR